MKTTYNNLFEAQHCLARPFICCIIQYTLLESTATHYPTAWPGKGSYNQILIAKTKSQDITTKAVCYLSSGESSLQGNMLATSKKIKHMLTSECLFISQGLHTLHD